MGSQADEVDWDRLDKNKFFLYGAGMFSGVTLTLYPLTVIKTKQMTLPGISGGFQGVKQTASIIIRTEGVPGFYRGFGTVICGTIPARAVYLTTLEWTKSEAAKLVGDLGLSGPAAAGAANFAGGAVASLATQSVTVPIDVISQKQMVHGDETVVARHQHIREGRTGLASATAPSAAPARFGSGAAAGAAAAEGSTGAGLRSGSAAAAATQPSGTSAEVAGFTRTPAPGSATANTAASSASACASSTPTAPMEASSRCSAVASTSGRQAHQPHSQTQAQTAVTRRIGAMQMVRLILKEEGVGGLYRGFGASVATFVPSSAVWWGAYGTYQKLIWAVRQRSPGESGGDPKLLQHSTREVVAVQTVASVLAGFTSGLVTTPVDLVKTRIQVSYRHDGATPTFSEVARQILREDGVSGFLRGAVPRMLNGALWGTCMVTVYEYLKRICAKEDGAP